MFRICAALVRSIYLLTVITSLVVGGWALAEFSTALLRQNMSRGAHVQGLVIFGILLAYVLPAIRAAIRLLRYRDLLPEANLRERPIVGAVVAVPAALGILLSYLVIRAWIDILPWGDEDAGGPLGGAMILTVLLQVFALLTGEIVLVGRTRLRRVSEV